MVTCERMVALLPRFDLVVLAVVEEEERVVFKFLTSRPGVHGQQIVLINSCHA